MFGKNAVTDSEVECFFTRLSSHLQHCSKIFGSSLSSMLNCKEKECHQSSSNDFSIKYLRKENVSDNSFLKTNP